MKSCIATLLLCSGALASNLFGAVSKFNLVALDDGNSISCANSDVRGRVAARGSTAFVNYNLACQANIESNPSFDDQCPQFGSWTCADLVAAGYAHGSPNYYGLITGDYGTGGNSVKFSNGQLSGGAAWGHSNGFNPSTLSNCDVIDYSRATYPLNWASVSSDLSALSSSIKSRAATGTTTFQYGTLTLVGSGSTDFETFSLNGADLSATNTLAISGVTAQTIFINVNGATVSLQGGAQALKSYSAKIVWNFYEATALNIVNYAVYGAVLAPTANLKNPAGVFWGQVFVNSFVSASADFWNPSLCAQVNYVPFTGLTPPSGDVCGDGIVQTGEDCDLGAASNGASSSCCSASCTFSPSSQVCRPAAGECDVPETCTGSSATCPTDVFKPEATPCSHPFGICDLELQYHCPGTGAQCVQETPAALFSFDAFNVVSFGNYSCDAGDVEGALAVRNFANLGGFDLGLKLSNNDAYTLFSLAVAGDASWSSGEVHPTTGSLYTYVDVHTNRTISKPWGYIGVGGTFNAPAYLQTSVLQNAYITAQQFDDAQTYYTKIQTLLASLNTNAAVSTIYGDGLQVTCSGDAELYHITVDGATLSTTNWYNTQGCSVRAGWIIDVTGSGDVTIKGAPFPGIVEKVVYNVLGSGRTIYGTNGVNGNILAPQNTYTQSTGVTYGRVIVGNVAQARQNNKPNCTDFSNVIITNAVLKPVTLGDTWIYVVDLDNYVVGDSVCGQGQCVQILQGIEFEGALAGEPKFALVLKAPFPTNLAASSYLSTVVDPNADRSDAITVTKQAAPTATSFDFSGASQVAVPFALLAIIFAMLF